MVLYYVFYSCIFFSVLTYFNLYIQKNYFLRYRLDYKELKQIMITRNVKVFNIRVHKVKCGLIRMTQFALCLKLPIHHSKYVFDFQLININFILTDTFKFDLRFSLCRAHIIAFFLLLQVHDEFHGIFLTSNIKLLILFF